jgi:SAM-dependent methyltransferase
MEIQQNLISWTKNPTLRKIYREFHQLLAKEMANIPGLKTVEIGSGIGNIKETILNCLRTDLFPNPWIDQIENAYNLSFSDESVSDLILFDVFHHLRFPGTVLKEFWRVLAPRGRVIIFDPALSLLGLIVFGCFHPEDLGVCRPIIWFAPDGRIPDEGDYYAAQGNATRIFLGRKFKERLPGWNLVETRKIAAIAYVFSGGYSKFQMYPDWFYPWMKLLDRLGSFLPSLFATRLLVVLEKKATD